MIPNQVTLKLGSFIADRRRQLCMSEYDFAEALDESVFYVSQAEKGMIDPELWSINWFGFHPAWGAIGLSMPAKAYFNF